MSKLVGNNSELTPQHPLELAIELKAPVLGLYGGADTGIPMDSVLKMQSALAQQPNADKSLIHVYPDTPHAFHADYRASYRETQAKDAWTRMLLWFAQHGVA